MKSFVLRMLVVGVLLTPNYGQDSEPAGPPTYPEVASSIKIRVYKLALSTSAECTSPVTVFESAAGVEADLVSKPTFGKGKIPSGTYNCMMIELSKVINVTGRDVCTTATDKLICPDSTTSQTIGSSTAGNVSCSGGTGNNQHVTLYFTTQATRTEANTYESRVLLPPQNGTDGNSGIKLPGALVYPNTRRGVLSIKKSILDTGCNIGAKFSVTTQ
ncbi:MAG: hypothetical protein ACOY5B_13100 [Spirochaetota bacterium]